LARRISLVLISLTIIVSAVLLGDMIPEVKAWEVLQRVICKDVKGTNYETWEPVDEVSAFSTTDEKVCLLVWFSVRDVPQSTKFRVIMTWYNPDGAMYAKYEGDIHGGTPWKWWRSIMIKGRALKKGKWAVELSFEGGPFKNEVLFKDFFTIGVKTLKIRLVNLPASVSSKIVVDGISAGSMLGMEEKSFELFEEESHTIVVDEYVPGTAGIRYRCAINTWNPVRVGTLTEWHEFTYETECQLTVTSPFGDVTGAGWYKKGSTASFSVSPTAPLEGFLGMLGGKRVFQKWTGDSSATSPSSTIVMDAPHQVAALWQEDIMMPMIIIVGLAAGLAIVVIVVIISRRGRGKAMPTPPLPTEAPTPITPPPPPTQEVGPATPEPSQILTKKHCMLCGEELPLAAGFCRKCGAKQES